MIVGKHRLLGAFRMSVNRLVTEWKTGGRRNPRFESLERLTTIHRDRECDPREVGLSPAIVDRIWKTVEAYYATGLHPAVSLVIRRHGKIVMSRGIGHAHVGASGESMHDHHTLVDADTPVCLFSASKAITAMLIHKLAEEGKLSLDDRVTRFLPAYAAHGKSATTILDLLTHRAGVHRLPVEGLDPETLFDFDRVVDIICATKPVAAPGQQQAYHALTAGFILGAIARSASGESLPALLERVVAAPLGCRHMTYGMAQETRHEAAVMHATGPARVAFASALIEKVLGVDVPRATDLVNHPRASESVVPAANLYASAEEVCRFYQMLLDGGRWEGKQVFERATVDVASRPGDMRLDRSFMIPVRFTPAFMAGEESWSLFGFQTPGVFGHLGFMNILCWADPRRDISVAFLNTGKSLAPEGVVGFFNVTHTISRAIPQRGPR